MNNWMTRILLREQQGDAGGAAGAAGAGGGTGGTGGTGANPPASGASDDPLFGASGTNAPQTPQSGVNGAGSGNNPPSVSIPENWKDALPVELRDLPFMKNITDVNTLVKNYENAQKMVGADKVVIPGKNASPEQWKETFQKLGLPTKIEDYKFDLDKSVDGKIDKPFLEGLTKKALESGILPFQTKALAEWFANANEEAWAESAKQSQIQQANEIKKLQTEWGDAYKGKVDAAKVALQEFTTPEERKLLQDMGIGKQPWFIKLMANAGATLGEHKILDGTQEGGMGGLTPAAAQAKIAEIKLNPKHAYWNAEDHGHIQAKKEFTHLMAMAYPEPKNT